MRLWAGNVHVRRPCGRVATRRLKAQAEARAVRDRAVAEVQAARAERDVQRARAERAECALACAKRGSAVLVAAEDGGARDIADPHAWAAPLVGSVLLWFALVAGLVAYGLAVEGPRM